MSLTSKALSSPTLDPRNLDRIFYGYFYDPTLVQKNYINESDIERGYYRKTLQVFHKLPSDYINPPDESSKPQLTLEFVKTIINDPLNGFTPDDQKGLCDIFSAISVKASTGIDAQNARPNYRIFQKELTLIKLHEKGYNISEFWENDPLNEGDAVKKLTAKENYTKATAKEILDKVRAHNTDDFAEIESSLSSDAGIQAYRAPDIPGALDKITYLIGFNDDPDDVDPRGWMELGSFNSIVAQAKAGKTQLMMQMAYCIQNGIPFFGYPVQQGEVLYVDFELRPNQILKRMNMLNQFYSDVLIGEPVTPYFVSASKIFSSGQVNLEELVDYCENAKRTIKNLKLIVFDCYYTFAEGDSNTEEDTRNTLLKLKKLVDDNTSVCYVHHTNKQGTKQMGNLDIIYAAGGSGVHGKIVDNTYVIKPKDGSEIKFEVFTTGRSNTGGQVMCTKNQSTHHYFKEDSRDHLMTLKEKAEMARINAEKMEREREGELEKTKKDNPELYKYIEEHPGVKPDQTTFHKKFPDFGTKELEAAGFYCETVMVGERVKKAFYVSKNHS